MKYSPAVDLIGRAAMREVATGRSEGVETEHFLIALTTGRDGLGAFGIPFSAGLW